jgi:hypothetical protein
MPTTVCGSSPRANHNLPDIVAIERMSNEIVSLAIGARKQTRAPKDAGVHQLRRDILRGRNKCYTAALRLAFADLKDGESIDDVTAPLYAAIHMIEAYAGDEADKALEAYIQIENDLKAEELKLEIEYLLGDKSTTLQRKLDLVYGKHASVIEHERRALHRGLLGAKIAVA